MIRIAECPKGQYKWPKEPKPDDRCSVCGKRYGKALMAMLETYVRTRRREKV
jgi:hypothetical protein